jgi:hypothetical protein
MRKSRTRSRPTRPALRPWSRASSPSVAETVLWLTRVRETGRAPICRNLARSWASWIVNEPLICAPVRPSIPSGFSQKLMIGRDLISLSRTTAKWSEN